MVIEQTDIQEIKDAVIKIRELSEDEKAKQSGNGQHFVNYFK